MHPISTRVLPDGISTTLYPASHKVHKEVLIDYARALSRVGQVVFPDVLAVIQDTEEATGLKPCDLMSGGDGEDNRVGYSIDTSVDLANSSHFDVNDALQGYSVWKKEQPGMADNWYIVMPNVQGVLFDEEPFNGVVIRLRHGKVISWDGRLIRHCTSLSRPDGPEGSIVSGRDCNHSNHLYGTFTAAKERIVNAGRKKAWQESGFSNGESDNEMSDLWN